MLHIMDSVKVRKIIRKNFCNTVIKTAYCLKLNEFWVFCPYPKSHTKKYYAVLFSESAM